jgi:hypothetical protein
MQNAKCKMQNGKWKRLKAKYLCGGIAVLLAAVY